MGSNGLTAARHLLLSHEYAEKYPETYSPTIDISKVYCGKYKVGDKLPGCDVDVIDAILSPTRTYAPIIRDILAQSAIRYTESSTAPVVVRASARLWRSHTYI